MSCIFCQILAGKIPCHRVWEDDRSFAFLDVRPIRPGHTLVIPKAHVDHFLDVPDADYAPLMAASKRIAKVVHALTQPKRVGLVIAGFDVPHTHVHVIPLQGFEDIGRGALPSNRPLPPSPETQAALAEQLRHAIQKEGKPHA